MREKLQGFFNRFISNDNGDITQTQRKQRGKLIVILVIVFLVLFILLRFTVNDETTEKERAEKRRKLEKKF